MIASSDGVKSDLDKQIVTDGKKVYYSETVYTKSLTGQQVPKRIKVYRVTIGKKSKEICSMKAYVGNREIVFRMMGIYGGKIIYCDGIDDIYSYSIKSRKHKELYSMTLDTDRIRQYNNFIYFQGGLWGTAGTVEILNAKNGRVTELSEDVMTEYKRVMYDELQRANYDIVNGKLYYLGGNQFRWESGGYDSVWPETYYVYAVYNNSEYRLDLYNSDGEYEVTFTLYEQYIP